MLAKEKKIVFNILIYSNLEKPHFFSLKSLIYFARLYEYIYNLYMYTYIIYIFLVGR